MEDVLRGAVMRFNCEARYDVVRPAGVGFDGGGGPGSSRETARGDGMGCAADDSVGRPRPRDVDEGEEPRRPSIESEARRSPILGLSLGVEGMSFSLTCSSEVE